MTAAQADPGPDTSIGSDTGTGDDGNGAGATPEALAAAVGAGDRRALARAITLVESARRDHREKAEALLERLLPLAGGSIRIGISGAPGVGKSTFIESFGLHLTGLGRRLAVLAVDPTSQLSGGSILGDKTRMERIGRRDDVFIRPSPAGSSLGGVARRTRESILLCEAAGFDVVLVETVGVGQSETAVVSMTDLFVLLLAPAGGDELQGMKKGIVELAGIILVNKADGALLEAANHAAADYRSALRMIRSPFPDWEVPVTCCSALTGEGIPEVWDAIERFRAVAEESGALASRRSEQSRMWMWSEVEEGLIAELRSRPATADRAAALEAAVAAGRCVPTAAARDLLAAFLAGGAAAAEPRTEAKPQPEAEATTKTRTETSGAVSARTGAGRAS